MKTLILIFFNLIVGLNLSFGQTINNLSSVDYDIRVWKHGKLITDQTLKAGESVDLPMSKILNPWMDNVLVQIKITNYVILSDLGAWYIEDGYVNLLLSYERLRSVGAWIFSGIDINFTVVNPRA